MLLGHHAPVLIRYNLFRGALLLAVEILTGGADVGLFPQTVWPCISASGQCQDSARNNPLGSTGKDLGKVK